MKSERLGVEWVEMRKILLVRGESRTEQHRKKECEKDGKSQTWRQVKKEPSMEIKRESHGRAENNGDVLRSAVCVVMSAGKIYEMLLNVASKQ